MSNQTIGELSFPETDHDALKNMILAQGIMIDFLDGIVQTMHENEQDILDLWQAAKAFQASAEVYTHG